MTSSIPLYNEHFNDAHLELVPVMFQSFFFTTLYMKVDTCNSMMQMMLSQGELTIFLGAFLPVKQYGLQEFQS